MVSNLNATSVSSIDRLFKKFIISKYFTQGWGQYNILRDILNNLTLIQNRERCCELCESTSPEVYASRAIKLTDYVNTAEGSFISPFSRIVEMDPVVSKSRFQLILPSSWKQTSYRPVVIHLAGTGDHFFWRRRVFLAVPLAKKYGIASVILENPFYGTRKPLDQFRSNLRYVADLFVMGGSLIVECHILLKWLESQGFGPLCLSGISMGGHMSSLAATAWPKPLALVPCLSWSTASHVFTKGDCDFEDTVFVLRELLDKVTHLGNYSNPVDTSRVTIVSALKDAYVPVTCEDVTDLCKDLWPTCKNLSLQLGHVAAVLTKRDVFLQAIVNSLSIRNNT